MLLEVEGGLDAEGIESYNWNRQVHAKVLEMRRWEEFAASLAASGFLTTRKIAAVPMTRIVDLALPSAVELRDSIFVRVHAVTTKPKRDKDLFR